MHNNKKGGVALEREQIEKDGAIYERKKGGGGEITLYLRVISRGVPHGDLGKKKGEGEKRNKNLGGGQKLENPAYQKATRE